MPVMNKGCMFHVDRLQFERMEREIKRAKLIPREYCHRLASAVCSCRKHTEWHPDENQLVEHAQYLQDMLQANKFKLPHFLAEVLKNVLETVNPSDYSSCRLLQILFLAHYDNFVLLTRSAIRDNAVASFNTEDLKNYQEYRQKEALKDKTLKLTNKMFKFSTHERMPIISSDDDLYGHNSTDAHAYECIDSLSKKGNLICALNRFTTRRNFNFDNNVNRSHIEIRRSHPGAVRTLRTLLKQKRREQHLNYCERTHTKTVNRQEKDVYSGQDAKDIDLDAKDRLTNDFELKTQKHESQTITRKSVKKSSVLDGGHCRQCLQPFTSLSPSSVCKHHPGYVMCGGWWSCCYTYVGWLYAANDLETSHAENGCEEGLHSWRIHKKMARKPNRDLLQRNPVLNIHLKEYLRAK